MVTPDMHRVHHSVIPKETDSNFGFNQSWWDRLFGTYIAQPCDGHEGMKIGLNEYQHAGPTRVWWALTPRPFLPKFGLEKTGSDAYLLLFRDTVTTNVTVK